MELVYLWIDEYKNIIKQEFNFSNKVIFNYDHREKVLSGSNKEYTINVYEDIPSIVNITAIIGENGSGKSTLLDFIANIHSGSRQTVHKYIAVYCDLNKKYSYITNGDFLINEANFCNIRMNNITSEFKNKFIMVAYDECLRNSFDFGTNHDGKYWFNYTLMGRLSFNNRLLNTLADNFETNLNLAISLQNSVVQLKAFEHFKVDNLHLLENNELILYLNRDDRGKILIDRIDAWNPAISIITDSNGNNIEDENHKKLIKQFKNKTSIFWMTVIKSSRKVKNEYKKNYAVVVAIMFALVKRMLLLSNNLNNNIKTIESWENICEKTQYNFTITDVKQIVEVYLPKNNKITNVYYKLSEVLLEANINFKADRRFIVRADSCYNGKKIIDILAEIYDNSFSFLFDFLEFHWPMSTGEYAYFNLYAWLYDASSKIDRNKTKSVVLVLDEVDLYMHPRWQQKYVHRLCYDIINKIFKGCKVQVFLSSHSPIILSDIPSDNVVYMDSGKNIT